MIVSRPSPNVALPTEKDWVIDETVHEEAPKTKMELAGFLIAQDFDLV